MNTHPNWLAKNSSDGPFIIDNVFIHPSASVHKTAHDHALVLHSIIGWNSIVGTWARVEGTPCDPNPNKPFAKMENVPLFNNNGHLNPSITVLGCNVQVPPEVIVLNSIVLPHKDLSQSYKNEIIL
ncbi:Mannose-1-phosphate guanyltransferase alpha [Araneus ventricosus]|uniref:Mannose-1-phosphate guanyltransferase alpha n=1 Tax=Araneus ventricosus TaxID=182803 RepID=A0A4Y2CA97_ARAVE|nr:Mannose-1-phosphate guanyltransferase alpha [Araneus ventricosus]